MLEINILYKNYFRKNEKQTNKETNLKNWTKLEDKYPNTFAGIYQFWVCKSE